MKDNGEIQTLLRAWPDSLSGFDHDTGSTSRELSVCEWPSEDTDFGWDTDPSTAPPSFVFGLVDAGHEHGLLDVCNGFEVQSPGVGLCSPPSEEGKRSPAPGLRTSGPFKAARSQNRSKRIQKSSDAAAKQAKEPYQVWREEIQQLFAEGKTLEELVPLYKGRVERKAIKNIRENGATRKKGSGRRDNPVTTAIGIDLAMEYIRDHLKKPSKRELANLYKRQVKDDGKDKGGWADKLLKRMKELLDVYLSDCLKAFNQV